MFKKFFLRLTSSIWGGWVSAIILLIMVGGIGLCIYFKSDDVNALKHAQLYVVIVIGLGSLYFAGTSFWAKQGSAFFVEYQTATDSKVAGYNVSLSTLEEIIGNPANSTMPYVKRIYIRNEKNKHEAIKRVLLQLPNKQTLILIKYEKADTLLIKPYEDTVLKLNAVTAYGKERDFPSERNRMLYRGDKFMLIPSEEILQKGKIIIETAQGQSYIINSKEPLAFYDKNKVLTPLRKLINTNYFNCMVLDIGIFNIEAIVMKKNFIDNKIFYDELIEEFSSQKIAIPIFNEREGTISIQITLNTNGEVLLCYFFQANKKIYAFPVQKKLQREFAESYSEGDFNELSHDEIIGQFKGFCRNWTKQKWGDSKDSIVDLLVGVNNPFAVATAVANIGIKIIDDEEP